MRGLGERVLFPQLVHIVRGRIRLGTLSRDEFWIQVREPERRVQLVLGEPVKVLFQAGKIILASVLHADNLL